jgi:tetratricopeptide (TPR) repeat protein
MDRCRHFILSLVLLLASGRAAPAAAPETSPLMRQPWFEARTTHFNIYSCGDPEAVGLVAARLEQFCEAYATLAGTQAVASPPVVVMAFPDHESLKPFLPLYNGQPANLAAFFQHGEDENLIVLSLPTDGNPTADLDVIFHEYTHLLLRRNDRIWPLWLKEGMAELYATFDTSGYQAQIARPIESHLRLLQEQPMMPLSELFAVSHDSPQYNERDRQGLFYAESWLLTHFLVNGDNPQLKARFRNFNLLLQQGQTPVQAFTNALQLSLTAVTGELQGYLDRQQFSAIEFPLPQNILAPKFMASRRLTPVENYFRLGDELLRINRLDEAGTLFELGRKLAPASPLPYEGLGLLALRREQPEAARQLLQDSLTRKSASYLVFYFHAWLSFLPVKNGQTELSSELGTNLHAELLRSIVLMPSFAPAHELFGIVELSRGGDFTLAEQHLQAAIQLAPENAYYQLALAEAEWQNHQAEAARRCVNALLLPSVEGEVRALARKLLLEMKAAQAGP